MEFQADQSLNHYRLIEKIGEGGMGVVWKALDTTLGREVALKMLPEEVAGHPERIARFQREARLLAALNHPNVATIHGFDTAAGHSFLVMELVSGQPLDEKLSRGALEVAETLDLMLQVTHGLESAHEKGIVHRDLKPANIHVTSEGVAKILDFGLAKAMDAAPEHDASKSPTITTGGTRAGAVMGTASYMSPEQARGEPLDRRTDIWSFGCVLFECLTGSGPFAASNSSDSVARLLEREPDWNALPGSTPAAVRRLIERCLRKDQRQRLRDIGDARILLNEQAGGLATTAAHPTSPGGANSDRQPGVEHVQISQPTARSRLPLPVLIGTLLVGLLAGAGGLWGLLPRQSPAQTPAQQILRSQLPLSEATALSFGVTRSVAISPDGRRVVYTSSQSANGASLMMKNLETGESSEIVGDTWASGPFFSPDGLWIAYFKELDGELIKISVGGGAPVRISATPISCRGGTWGPDGNIVFSDSYNGGLSIVSAGGGTPAQLTALREGEKSHRHPAYLPDGETILFVIGRRDLRKWNDADIATLNMETGAITTVVQGGTQPAWSPTGHILYSSGGNLYAVRYDPVNGDVGVPFQVLEEVAMDPMDAPAHYALSREGTLVYAAGGEITSVTSLLAVDPDGKAHDMNLPARSYFRARSSPDGRTLALQVEEANTSVWTYDLDRKTLSRLSSGWEAEVPVWLPSGEQILYSSRRDNSYVVLRHDVGGRGKPVEVFAQEVPLLLEDVSADGRWLAAATVSVETGQDIVLLDLHDPQATQGLVVTADNEFQPAISPDGEWLAYVSDESGQQEIYVTDFPAGIRRQALTNGGGDLPLWSADGRSLFYRNGTVMMAMSRDASGSFSDAPPRRLFQADWIHDPDPRLTSSRLDNQGRFILFRAENPESPQALSLIVNFPVLLRGKQSAAR